MPPLTHIREIAREFECSLLSTRFLVDEDADFSLDRDPAQQIALNYFNKRRCVRINFLGQRCGRDRSEAVVDQIAKQFLSN